MARVGVVADVHGGNHKQHGGAYSAGVNERCRAIAGALERVMEAAVADDLSCLISAGDLFDRTHPTPQEQACIAAAMQGPIPWDVIVGNHEQKSMASGDNALAMLGRVDLIRVEERAVVRSAGDGSRVLLVPYQPEPVIGWVEDAIVQALAGSPPGGPLLMVGHFGVEDSRTPPWLRGAHDSIKLADLVPICERHGITEVVVGNWHDHRRWKMLGGKVTVWQCGALVPTGYDNPSTGNLRPGSDPYGSLVTWDSAKGDGDRLSRRVIPGPRFVKTASMAEVQRALSDAHGNDVYFRVTSSYDAVDDVDRELARLGAEHYAIVVDADDVRVRVESAALAARDAETTDRAIVEWIERAHPQDGDVEPSTVLGLCRGYLAGRNAEWSPSPK